MCLSVNGTVVNSRLAFPATLSLGSWQTVALSASLLKGANTIRLTTVGGATPQVDYLLLPINQKGELRNRRHVQPLPQQKHQCWQKPDRLN